jgi:hypothetical protein
MLGNSVYQCKKPVELRKKKKYTWGTPTKNDGGNRKPSPSQMRRNAKGLASSAFLRDRPNFCVQRYGEEQYDCVVNPNWVEWLMGWPINWTSTDPLKTLDEYGYDWFTPEWWDREWKDRLQFEPPMTRREAAYPKSRIQSLGNGQVPIAVAAAIYYLSPWSPFLSLPVQGKASKKPTKRYRNPSSPVREAFEDLSAYVQERVPDLPRIKLEVDCKYAIQDHEEELRVFAHTLHLKDTICVHSDLNKLSDAYIYGILAHEFGHIIADTFWDDPDEEAADLAAREFLGLDIFYGSEYDLEYLSSYDIMKVKE